MYYMHFWTRPSLQLSRISEIVYPDREYVKYTYSVRQPKNNSG